MLAACYGSFKFQSDSINTETAEYLEVTEEYSLNSNLILLILEEHFDDYMLEWGTLNSNLILLIPRPDQRLLMLLSALNSNLILLIL